MSSVPEFTVRVYRDASQWVAECIDLKLGTLGPTAVDALDTFLSAFEAQQQLRERHGTTWSKPDHASVDTMQHDAYDPDPHDPQQKATQEDVQRMVRDHIKKARSLAANGLSKGREQALLLTKLDEAEMWLDRM